MGHECLTSAREQPCWFQDERARGDTARDRDREAARLAWRSILYGMCRMVGYLGSALPVRALLDDAPHSLERQSYAARELNGSVVSADGWGLSFYVPHEREPCVYRSGLPIWADANRLSLGRAIQSSCVLGAVRSATDPLGHGIVNTQPFSFGTLSFLHNGYVRPFRGRLMRELRDGLGDEAYALVRGDTDSEHFFALVVDEWLAEPEASGEDEGRRLHRALSRATARLCALCERHEAHVLVTAILSDGERLVFTRALALNQSESRGASSAPSLYARSTEQGFTVASEPLDDAATWRSVDEGSFALVERREGALVVRT